MLFQEQLRKRKEEEERAAAQNEFLNRSLRGSRKLQALESRPHGHVNDGYSSEDQELASSKPLDTISSFQQFGDRELVYIRYGEKIFILKYLLFFKFYPSNFIFRNFTILQNVTTIFTVTTVPIYV